MLMQLEAISKKRQGRGCELFLLSPDRFRRATVGVVAVAKGIHEGIYMMENSEVEEYFVENMHIYSLCTDHYLYGCWGQSQNRSYVKPPLRHQPHEMLVLGSLLRCTARRAAILTPDWFFSC
jgi:hypothetical protein